jgi:uncharacterized membrane protein YidH (DUF202 family)
MEQSWKIFIAIGLAFILFGIILAVGGRLHLGRLPGDIMVKRENFTFYFPLMTGIVLSIVVSLIIRLLNRLL